MDAQEGDGADAKAEKVVLFSGGGGAGAGGESGGFAGVGAREGEVNCAREERDGGVAGGDLRGVVRVGGGW